MRSLLTFLVCAVSCGFGRCEQDYIVTNVDVESFDGTTETLVEMSDLKTIAREKFFNGTWNVLKDMDDEHFKFSLGLYSSPNGDGDYRRMAAGVPNTAVCEGFKKFYVQFVEPCMQLDVNTNFPFIGEEGLCPIPAGTYYIKHINLDTKKWPNQVPRGLLKAVLTFYKNDVPVGGANFVLKIEDKE